MAKATILGLWASDDGSYGDGEITVVDTSNWTAKQWRWYEKLSDSGEVYAEDLQNIDDGIKPEYA